MAERLFPSPEALRQLIRYEPDTGHLLWKERGPEWFIAGEGRYTANRAARVWNSKYARKVAIDCLDPSNGYRKGTVLDTRVYAHRVIWALQVGAWPDGDIDHINGNRADNRWENLRSVPRKINARNTKRRETNTSGMMGVSQYGAHGRWRARIMADGKTTNIGCFDTYEAACEARQAAEAAMGFHPNHGRE
ncbi:HNH endonuclease [Paracoccus aminovorans]|uniref:HNH endonuclease n=1 Tax=Paracoccus aminovorans TaxID=34004 RepID=UPI0009E68225|nr:HNH endonuclease [Paracoccus aminovorans]MDQ7776289.1 HNH endonuclease [Paracoccus aminovorans]